MKFFFLGDVVINTNEIKPSQNLIDLFASADYRICNFEGPLVSPNSKKIIKTGPHVYQQDLSIDFLKDLNINIVGLANNHIMDYGKESLAKTINLLNDNNIITVGAGFSFEQVYNPLILEENTERICILNACQAEFGVAKSRKAEVGYAWINSPVFKNSLKYQLNNCDKVILFLHAGMEDQIVPLPEWKQIYHDFADIIQGRGTIIATHPHIVQGYEIYNKTPIFYSLGNFAFYKDELKDSVEWNRSLMVQYNTESNEAVAIPVSMKDGVIDIDTSLHFKKDIEYRCSLVKDDVSLNRLANEIAEKSWNEYYKSYYECLVLKTDVSSCSNIQLIKTIIKRLLNVLFNNRFNLNSSIIFNETMLLHNIQIESHRWCVERYLYNQNVKNNEF